MPSYFEILRPILKTDPESKEGFLKAWPDSISQTWKDDPVMKNAFAGWIVEEDGKDVRGEFLWVIVVEWSSYQDYKDFLGSERFMKLVGNIKGFVAGRAAPQLFETNISVVDAAQKPVTQIVRTAIPDGKEKIWDAWGELGGETGEVAKGASLNLEGKMFVGVLGWESLEAGEKLETNKGLEKLGGVGDTTSFLAELKPLRDVVV